MREGVFDQTAAPSLETEQGSRMCAHGETEVDAINASESIVRHQWRSFSMMAGTATEETNRINETLTRISLEKRISSVTDTMEGSSEKADFDNLMRVTLSSTLLAFQEKVRLIETEAKRYFELKEARQKAQTVMDVLATKAMFVRSVSHEIRTPLTVVMSGIEVLRQELRLSNPRLLEVIDAVSFSCKVAIETLNDLLTYEKLEGSLLVLEKRKWNLIATVQAVVDQFQIQSTASNIELTFEDTIHLQVLVLMDVTKISQVLRNLISNALKFTPSGGSVTVIASLREDIIRIEVHDTGPGISTVSDIR